jgi:hypothetical protein
MLIVSNEHKSLEKIFESKLSDDYEKLIADSINSLSKDHVYIAERPISNNKFSDVFVKRNDGVSSWLEVKMDHHAGLGSPRVYYSDYEGGWCTTYKTPSAAFAVNLLNSSDEAAMWIKQFKKWLCKELATSDNEKLREIVCRHRNDNHYRPCDLKIVLPTTAGGLDLHGAIPVEVMNKFVAENPRTILNYSCDITDVVTDHYLKGKTEPAYYIQIDDDLYRLGDENPFKWNVPKLSITSGNIIARISISNSKLYEIQVDVKSHEFCSSDYSLKLDSDKMRPF